jgi:hypothetical protein
VREGSAARCSLRADALTGIALGRAYRADRRSIGALRASLRATERDGRAFGAFSGAAEPERHASGFVVRANRAILVATERSREAGGEHRGAAMGSGLAERRRGGAVGVMLVGEVRQLGVRVVGVDAGVGAGVVDARAEGTADREDGDVTIAGA